MRTIWAIGWMVTAAAGAAAAPVTFTETPTVEKVREAYVITFAISALTDVEVAVLDGRGQVVRHLAAGKLGPNAPAPLAKGALKQALPWDGKDDRGRPAGNGPFTVRVAAGLMPTFDRLIGYNPGALANVESLAVAPDGTLYVFHSFGDLHPSDSTTVCVAYDRTGNYLRQVIPYPANLPDEKLAGIKRITVGGKTIPFLYQAETRSVIPGVGALPMHKSVVTRDGRLAFVGHHEWVGTTLRYNQRGTKQLTVVHTDGGVPPGGVLGAVLTTGAAGSPDLALSPDEKTLYLTGLQTGSGERLKRFHAVYRCAWQDTEPRALIGTPDTAGHGPTGLNTPRSLDTDRDGNLYVADRGNNRIAVFKADGAFLGEIPVDRPERVQVHPKTGAVYVLGGEFVRELKKFASWRAKQPTAEALLPYYKHANYTALLAVDGSADPAVVWVAAGSNWARFKLLRLEDQGTAFGEGVDLDKMPQNSLPHAGPRTRYNLYTGGSIMGLALDRRNDRLYVNKRVYDLKADRWDEGFLAAEGSKDGMGSFGLDGHFYSQAYPRSITRLGPDGKVIPFTAGATKGGILQGPEDGSMRLRGRGITADAQGNIYALLEKGKGLSKEGDAGDANNLFLFAPDGQLKNAALIDSEIRGLNSVRLDYQGNIYLAIGVRPKGKLVPDAFAGLDLGQAWKYGMNANDLNWYPYLYGAIVKFGPEGGAVRTGTGGIPVEYSAPPKNLKTTELKGARWMFFGASPVPSWRIGYPDVCLCESPRFDVDGFGRSFFTDAARFRCGIIDTNGNELAWFGDYGNQDSAGPRSAIPEPPIAFYWPYMICVDGRRIYVADRMNRRVVAVRLEYAAEASRPVP